MPRNLKNSQNLALLFTCLAVLTSCGPKAATQIENEAPRLKYGETTATLNCLDSGAITQPHSTTAFQVTGCDPHSVEHLQFEKPPSEIDVTPLCRDGLVKISSKQRSLNQTLIMEADGNFSLDSSMELNFTDNVARPGPCAAQFLVSIKGKAFCRSETVHGLDRVELTTEWHELPKLSPYQCPNTVGCQFTTATKLSCPN